MDGPNEARVPGHVRTLKHLFESKGVLIVASSLRAGSPGAQALEYLTRFGYQGRIIAVSPDGGSTPGVSYAARIAELSSEQTDSVDHALVLVRNDSVIDVLQQCTGTGIRAASVFSSGWGETGEDGARRQIELVTAARELGIRILGPNCLGVANVHTGQISSPANAYTQTKLTAGPISVVSQSGATAGYIVGLLADRGYGFSKIATVGNESDISTGEILTYLAEDALTEVILMYLEGVHDVSTLLSGLDAVRRSGVPLIVLKVGGTEIGERAVRSHTAALAGNDAAFAAILESTGAFRATSLRELTSCAEIVLTRRPLDRAVENVVVFSTSGGSGVMAAESLERDGFTLPAVPANIQDRIKELLPLSAPLNPIDLSASVAGKPEAFSGAIDACLEAQLADAAVICVTNTPRTPAKFSGIREELLTSIRAHRASGVRFIVQGALSDDDRSAFRNVGAITSEDPCEAGELLSRVKRLATLRAGARDITPQLPSPHPTAQERSLDEDSAISVLEAFGVPFPGWSVIDFEPDGPLPPHQMHFPLAVKKLVPGVTHKSELGNVRLGVGDNVALLQALNEMSSAPVERFVLMEMATGISLELLVGTSVDPIFGRLFMLALGGKFAEFLARSVVLIPPITETVVRSALRDIGISELVYGYRGDAPVDVNGIFEVLQAFERVIQEHPLTTELEVNPLVVLSRTGSVLAVDAVVRERQPLHGAP